MAFTKHCWTERTPLLSMFQLCLLPSTLTLALEDLVFHEMLQCNNLCILRISSTGITAISPFSKNLFEMILSILPGLVNHQKCNFFRHSQSSWTCTIWARKCTPLSQSQLRFAVIGWLIFMPKTYTFRDLDGSVDFCLFFSNSWSRNLYNFVFITLRFWEIMSDMILCSKTIWRLRALM